MNISRGFNLHVRLGETFRFIHVEMIPLYPDADHGKKSQALEQFALVKYE